MADVQEIKKTAAQVLLCVEKVTSFVSSVHPMFGFISSLVRVARKGLVDDDKTSALEQDFLAIQTKLESISVKNRQCLRDLHIEEVNVTYGKYEEYIKHQYTAFKDMISKMNKDPQNAESYMNTFKDIYEKDKSEMNLDVFYRGVMGIKTVFGKALLDVYYDSCDGDPEIMEHRCSHIMNLFHQGLIALMGYTEVDPDNEDGMPEKWTKRIEEIQKKMEEVLNRCQSK